LETLSPLAKQSRFAALFPGGDFEPENYRIQGGSPHRRFGKREMNTISIVTIACDMWTNMK